MFAATNTKTSSFSISIIANIEYAAHQNTKTAVLV